MFFYDREECLNVSPYIDEYGTKSGIFVFKNIIKPELVEKIESQLKILDTTNLSYDDTLIDWYSQRVTPHLDGLIDVWEQISEILAPQWVIHPASNLLIVRPGDNGMFTHTDSPGKNMCHLLSQVDRWSTCCLLDYGVVAYFGDFEGGEIFYPGINPDGTPKEKHDDGPCFEYKPEKGDLVIHSAFNPYGHGVREVKSGTRYAFSNFCLKAEDNPGTFNNYGTPEYIEQIGDKSLDFVKKWSKPLKENPQFSKDKIAEMQASGLEGKELSEKFFSHLKETE